MEKLYIEMNEAERQLTLIENNLDYAICVMSEGLEESSCSLINEEIRQLQGDICSKLLLAISGVQTYLKAIRSDEK